MVDLFGCDFGPAGRSLFGGETRRGDWDAEGRRRFRWYDSGRLPLVKSSVPLRITSGGWTNLDGLDDDDEDEDVVQSRWETGVRRSSRRRRKKWRRRAVPLKTFRDAAVRISTSKKISSDMMGRFKGRLLQRADLPAESCERVAKQLDWPLPRVDANMGKSRRQRPVTRRPEDRGRRLSMVTMPATIGTLVGEDRGGDKAGGDALDDIVEVASSASSEHESDDDDDDDYVDVDDDIEDDDEEETSYEQYDSQEAREDDELQSAFLDFACRLDVLGDQEVEEMTSGLVTGLKSWLQFGASISSATSGVEVETRMATFLHRTQGASELRKLEREVMRQMAATMTLDPDEDDDEDGDNGGQRRKGATTASRKSRRSARVALDVAAAIRGEDRLTKRAEERAAKIASDFCVWLRDLPRGADDTVNTMPEEHIRALFDAGQTANAATSKVAQGLRSWADFGAQVTGGKADRIAQITKHQIDKSRFRKQVESRKGKRSGVRDKNARKTTDSYSKFGQPESQALFDERERQERRSQYGGQVWHLPPSTWNSRFRRVLEEARFGSSVEATLASTIPATERPLLSSMERSNVSDILSSGGSSQDTTLQVSSAHKKGRSRRDKRRVESRSASPLARQLQHQELQASSRRGSRMSDQLQMEQASTRPDDDRGDESSDGRVLAELDSSRAFAEFLSRRGKGLNNAYVVPEFLADVIRLPKVGESAEKSQDKVEGKA